MRKEKREIMNFVEFKKLALSDPYSTDDEFVEQTKSCPKSYKYLQDIRQMDTDLSASLDVELPSELMANLKLNQELKQQTVNRSMFQRYSIAASVAIVMLVGGLLMNMQFNNTITQDYQSLLSGVVEHMNEKPVTPVWDTSQANRTVGTLLSSYDVGLKMKNLENLTFGRICPMGKYRGLHATLDTEDGPVTFAYIKGEPVGEVISASYQGYMTRVKPLQGGNLIIISRTKRALEQTDKQLNDALYWDI